jgi:hypothetical protein
MHLQHTTALEGVWWPLLALIFYSILPISPLMCSSTNDFAANPGENVLQVGPITLVSFLLHMPHACLAVSCVALPCLCLAFAKHQTLTVYSFLLLLQNLGNFLVGIMLVSTIAVHMVLFVSGASAFVTFICALYTLRTQISQSIRHFTHGGSTSI